MGLRITKTSTMAQPNPYQGSTQQSQQFISQGQQSSQQRISRTEQTMSRQVTTQQRGDLFFSKKDLCEVYLNDCIFLIWLLNTQRFQL